MQFLPTTVPTSSEIGFLPMALTALENVVQEMYRGSSGPTTQQHIVAHSIATVYVAVSAFFDVVLVHPISFAVKLPGVVVKALAGLISDLDEDMPEAFDVQDWLGHARKIYTSFVMFVNAGLIGPCDPEGVLLLGRKFDLLGLPRAPQRPEDHIEEPSEV